MKKITFFIPFVAIFLMAFSCSKSDDDTIVAVRDFDEQYATDEAAIQDFFTDYHMDVDADFNVTFTKIPTTGSTLVSIKNQTNYTMIDTNVVYNSKEYKIHFIKFREGDHTFGKRPTQADSIFVSYKGMHLTGTQFDGADNPIWLKMQGLITGWSHILPSFLTGTYSSASPADPPVFNNYGAGVMFLPSGFGYFNNSNSSSGIGSYEPLIFSFKLYELRYRDQDGDGILSKDERDLTTEPNILYKWKINPLKYDSDGDGVANMYDIDDDNDHYLTKNEIKYVNPADPDHIVRRYPFDGNITNTDDPLTLYVDERDGIPDCSNDKRSPSRKRRHLDPACHGN